MSCDDDACGRNPCATSSCAKNDKNGATTPEAKTSEAKTETNGKTHDLSAAQVTDDGKSITIHVGAPGVRHSDVKVTQLDDHVLSVQGESTTASGEAFKVDQAFQLPANVDMASLRASHTDGRLTIVVKRKFTRVNIPVNAEVQVEPSAPATAEVDEGEGEEGEGEGAEAPAGGAVANPDDESDEWEDLPADRLSGLRARPPASGSSIAG